MEQFVKEIMMRQLWLGKLEINDFLDRGYFIFGSCRVGSKKIVKLL
jgi:hypothetical protein